MKHNHIYFYLLLLTLCVIISGCGTSNSKKAKTAADVNNTVDSTSKNYIEINGATYTLKVENIATNEYNVLSMLAINDKGSTIHQLEISMYSNPISYDLKEGTFTFHDDDNGYNPKKHFYDITITGASPVDSYQSGKITISKARSGEPECFVADFDFLFTSSPKENGLNIDSLLVRGHYEGLVKTERGQAESVVEYDDYTSKINWKTLIDDETEVPENYIVIDGTRLKNIAHCSIDTMSSPEYCNLEFYEYCDFDDWKRYNSDTPWTYSRHNTIFCIQFRKESLKGALPVGTFEMRVDGWGKKRNRNFNPAKHFTYAGYTEGNTQSWFVGGRVIIAKKQQDENGYRDESEYEITFDLFSPEKTEGKYTGHVMMFNPYAKSKKELFTEITTPVY